MCWYSYASQNNKYTNPSLVKCKLNCTFRNFFFSQCRRHEWAWYFPRAFQMHCPKESDLRFESGYKPGYPSPSGFLSTNHFLCCPALDASLPLFPSHSILWSSGSTSPSCHCCTQAAPRLVLSQTPPCTKTPWKPNIFKLLWFFNILVHQ